MESLVACGRHTPKQVILVDEISEWMEHSILNRMERSVVMYVRSFDVSTAINHDQSSHETIMNF